MFIKLVCFWYMLNLPAMMCLVKLRPQKSELKDKPSSLISVQTELGNLIGYKKDVQNKTINVFYGVPYAG